MDKTVRELSGDIATTLMKLQLLEDPILKDLNVETTGYIVDLITEILARHIGTTIQQDKDLPVKPYPNINEEVGE